MARRLWQRAARTAVVAAVLLGVASGSAQADRAFAPRFSANDSGDITLVGNTLMTCPASAACTNAQQGQGAALADLNNNTYAMVRVDVDSDSTTFDSSSATLNLPAGATVLFAGLYYGGDVGGTGGSAPPNAAARGTVRLRTPADAGYQTLTGSVDDSGARYQGFVDVTDRVRAAGNGTYTAANVQSSLGTDRLAGWSLVVAYRDASQAPRNLTIFDGLKNIAQTAPPTDIPVSGFTTPPAGPVRSSVGLITYEGDLGITGDTATLLTSKGTYRLSNSQNPVSNYFNSSISLFGNPFTAKNPNYLNQFGYDADLLDADGYLGNGDTSASIRVTTSGDQYLPGVVTFSTELYAPNVVPAKSVQNVTRTSGATQPGDVLRYTVSYPNNGQDAATGFTSTDPIPDHGTYVPGSLKVASGPNTGAKTDAAGDDQAEYDAAGERVRVRLGTGANGTRGGSLAPGASTGYTFDVKVDPDATDGVDLVNVASADFTGAQLGVPFIDQRTPAVTTRVRRPDLRLGKTHTGTLTAGDTATFQLIARNAGGAPTTAPVTVTDSFPAASFDAIHDVGGPGWDCSATTGLTLSCTRSDTLGAGDSYPAISVDADVAANPPNDIVNTAAASGGGDNSPGDNAATDTGQNTPRADLSLTAGAVPATVAVGQTVDFSLTARNGGPSPATNTTVTTTLPAGMTFVSGPPGCTASGQVVTCDLGTLAKNASRTVQITARATAAANGSDVTATATVGSSVADPDTSNNGASTTVTVPNTADVAITTTPSTLTPSTGSAFGYALKVDNRGPGAATGLTVTDVLPPTFTYTGVSAPGWNCDPPGADRKLTCVYTGSLASGATSTITVNGSLTTAAEGTFVTNSAGVTTTAVDPDTTNNSSTSTVTTTPAADLSLSKRFSAAQANTGTNVQVTLRATNAGPSTATNASITDVLPAGLTYVSSTGNLCSASGQTVTCGVGDLNSGAAADRVITVAVAQAGSGVIVNDARIASPTTKDPEPSNNVGEARLTVNAATDIGVTQTATPTASVGGSVTYTLKVTNNGPDGATGVRLSDPLPAGMTFASVTPSAGSCGATNGVVSCTFGALSSGETRTVTIVATPGPSTAGTTVKNTATVAADTFDPEPTNDSADGTTAIAPQADLSIVKTVPATTARVNQDITYTLEVANAGPSAATQTTVTDPLPAGTDFVSASAGCVYALGQVSCDLGTIPANGIVSRTVTVQSTFGNAETTVNNQATVASATDDPDSADNTSGVAVQVGPQIDLRLTGSVSNPNPSVGDQFTFDFTARNTGPSSSTNTTFTDVLPVGVELTSVPAGCSASGQTVTCDLGTVPSNGTAAISLPVRLTPAGAGASLTDAATVTGAQDEANPNNNQARAQLAGQPAVDLSLTKTATTPSPQAGGQSTYTMVVTNAGPDTATNVRLSDPLPAGLRAVSATPTQGSCSVSTGICDLGSIAPGGSAQVVLVTDVTGPAGTPITNIASVSADETELTPAGTAAMATVTPVSAAGGPGGGGSAPGLGAMGTPDLHIDKVVDDRHSRVGQSLHYRITVINRGTAAAPAVEVTDGFDRGADIESVRASRGRCSTRRIISCDLGTVAAGARVTIVVTARPLGPGTTWNRAVVVGAGRVTRDADDSVANAWTNVSLNPTRVVVSKRALRSTAAAGDTLPYVITARNVGSHEARDVRVCDTLPTGLSFVSAPGARFRAGRACWTIDRLGTGRARTLRIVTRVQRLAKPADVRNTVAVWGDNARRRVAGDSVHVRPGASRPDGVTG